ncbi:MAG: CvpA family protein [Clostridia bacterium]|nr:CvpA family protein [Clostridia bacterium]
MIFDIAFVLIILLGAIIGFKKGIAKSIGTLISWVLALAVPYFIGDYVRNLLIKYTGLDEFFQNQLYGEYAEQLLIPIMGAVTFLLLFLAIKIFLKLIFSLFEGGRDKQGIINGFFGMLLGIIKALLILIVLIIAVIPIALSVSEGFYDFFSSQFGTSTVLPVIYGNNVLEILLQ